MRHFKLAFIATLLAPTALLAQLVVPPSAPLVTTGAGGSGGSSGGYCSSTGIMLPTSLDATSDLSMSGISNACALADHAHATWITSQGSQSTQLLQSWLDLITPWEPAAITKVVTMSNPSSTPCDVTFVQGLAMSTTCPAISLGPEIFLNAYGATMTSSPAAGFGDPAPSAAGDGITISVGSLPTPNGWVSPSSTSWWIQAQLPTPLVVAGYKLYPFSTNPSGYLDFSLNPLTWTFSGSGDGVTWAVLDTVLQHPVASGQWSVANGKGIMFTFVPTSTAFSYYRIDITGTVISNPGIPAYVGICEWTLLPAIYTP